ncbi:GNAT family N-acetyltransferase [Cognatishimia sp. F0-27]|uniref:GNAT family N-acetyltransferase n=1 Tax=Cognatishimia sp. F0-27 TaxID=2816855 RepID=UPI001D0C3E55|nr:GNAT family N-acetyltransferase [Cognatishimia sp. F0-27]MCC1490975.1 GNAT family N-acetyltransferase [Cognatishimia sp. F0-27]
MSVEIPILQTERLTLRGPKLEDHAHLCAYYADPRSKWNGGPLDETNCWRVLMATAGQWQLRGYGLWYAFLRESGDVVGFAGIFHPHDWPEPELGWGVMAAYEGTGLAFEAASAARAACATQLGLTALPSFVAETNLRSRRLAARMGAVEERRAVLRDTLLIVYRHPHGAGPSSATPTGGDDAVNCPAGKERLS